jgi:hypothetical protein
MTAFPDTISRAITAWSQRKSRSRLLWSGVWAGLALVLLTTAVVSHWPVRHGYFQVDDFVWLHIANWRSVAASFIGSDGSHVAYRPIFRLSTYIDALLFGRNPIPWHFENVALHATNALLLAATVRAFRLPLSLAAAAAILFALAPLSEESVNWISGRTSLLCCFFMLLAVWRWAVALRRHHPPYAAAIWMLMAAMTYEAAIVMPAILVCLIPLACQRLRVGWRYAVTQAVLLGAVLAIFWLLRAAALGTTSAEVDATSPDLIANFEEHLSALYDFAWFRAGRAIFLLLAASVGLAVLAPRLFPAGLLLLAIALILYLPYVPLAGVGPRFFYMLQAPICVAAVLPALLLPPRLRGLALLLLLALVLPRFAQVTRREAAQFADAGVATAALIAAVHEAIPANDGNPNVIEGVPELHRGRFMIGGDFFELAIADSYETTRPPLVTRSVTVLSDPQVLKDVLSVPTSFWRYDPVERRLVWIDCRSWLDAQRGKIIDPDVLRTGCAN